MRNRSRRSLDFWWLGWRRVHSPEWQTSYSMMTQPWHCYWQSRASRSAYLSLAYPPNDPATHMMNVLNNLGIVGACDARSPTLNLTSVRNMSRMTLPPPHLLVLLAKRTSCNFVYFLKFLIGGKKRPGWKTVSKVQAMPIIIPSSKRNSFSFRISLFPQPRSSGVKPAISGIR